MLLYCLEGVFAFVVYNYLAAFSLYILLLVEHDECVWLTRVRRKGVLLVLVLVEESIAFYRVLLVFFGDSGEEAVVFGESIFAAQHY